MCSSDLPKDFYGHSLSVSDVVVLHKDGKDNALDHFRDGDLAGLVQVNHAAFSHHPEQGGLTTADFTARMASDWYRDRDLLVARDTAGGLAGFHWTKLTSESGQPVGEVYVLAVAPGSAGRGVGGALLDAGIMHMQARGVLRIDLYVEAANDRVVELYRRSGFKIGRAHV